jgi:hypothetical protein
VAGEVAGAGERRTYCWGCLRSRCSPLRAPTSPLQLRTNARRVCWADGLPALTGAGGRWAGARGGDGQRGGGRARRAARWRARRARRRARARARARAMRAQCVFFRGLCVSCDERGDVSAALHFSALLLGRAATPGRASRARATPSCEGSAAAEAPARGERVRWRAGRTMPGGGSVERDAVWGPVVDVDPPCAARRGRFRSGFGQPGGPVAGTYTSAWRLSAPRAAGAHTAPRVPRNGSCRQAPWTAGRWGARGWGRGGGGPKEPRFLSFCFALRKPLPTCLRPPVPRLNAHHGALASIQKRRARLGAQQSLDPTGG